MYNTRLFWGNIRSFSSNILEFKCFLSRHHFFFKIAKPKFRGFFMIKMSIFLSFRRKRPLEGNYFHWKDSADHPVHLLLQ